MQGPERCSVATGGGGEGEKTGKEKTFLKTAGAGVADDLTVTLPAGLTTLRTLTGTTATNQDILVNATAAQIAALTTVTSGADNGNFRLVASDTGSVTVNLAAVTGSATFVDAISFAATTAGNVVTVTNGALNTLVIGGASTTADVLTINAAYAGGTVMAATAFEIVNFTMLNPLMC